MFGARDRALARERFHHGDTEDTEKWGRKMEPRMDADERGSEWSFEWIGSFICVHPRVHPRFHCLVGAVGARKMVGL